MKDNEATNNEVSELQKENKDISKNLGEHLLRRMLISWLAFPVISVSALLIGIFIGQQARSSGSSGSEINLNLATLQTANSDIFIATLTVAGLAMGIIPIVSFYYLSELKDIWGDIKSNLLFRKKRKSEKIKQLFYTQEYLLEALLTNRKKVIKRYTQITLIFSAFALFFLVFAYMMFGVQSAFQSETVSIVNATVINMMLNVELLIAIIGAVFPLVSLALYDAGYKVFRGYDVKGKEVMLVYPE